MPGRIEMGYGYKEPSRVMANVQTKTFECCKCKKQFQSESRNKGKRYCGDCRVKKF